MLGTPDFIAPEQIADAQGADIRADIYSLGCTLYYLLSGRPPFQAASMLDDMLQAHRSTDARLLNFVRPEVPAELAAVVAKMMAKEPDRRFQTPSEVAKALAPFFKKPTAASVSPNLEVDPDFAAACRVGPAPDPAAETGRGMWSSLIDFRQDRRRRGLGRQCARSGPRSTAMAVAGGRPAGVLLCGLLGAWAAGVFTSRDRDRRLRSSWRGAEASIAIDETRSWSACRKSRSNPSEPAKPSSPVAEHAPETEAAGTHVRRRRTSRHRIGDGSRA